VTPERKSALIGYAALAITVLIWSAWIVYTREGMQHALPISVIVLMRMLVPAVVLSPVIWRVGVLGRGHPVALLFCILGAGIPHIALSAAGLRYANSSDYAALVPGTLPVFVAVISAFLFKEKFGLVRTIGLVCTVLGVISIAQHGLFSGDDNINFGHLVFLLVALNYSGYALGFRRSGLTPVEATALVAFWSCLIILPFSLMPALELLRTGHIHELLFQAFLQGVLSNLVALVTFSEGVRRLGSSRAAAFTALVPVGATLFAIPVLGEWPDVWAVAGVVMTSIGVVLASGILALRGNAQGLATSVSARVIQGHGQGRDSHHRS
jgi:drug/metabolite transporter (DMT)-like permease